MRTRTRPGGFSWNEYAMVCERLSEGASVTRIAREMGRCESTLHEWLRRLELIPPPKPRKSRRRPAQAQVLEFVPLEQAWRKAA